MTRPDQLYVMFSVVPVALQLYGHSNVLLSVALKLEAVGVVALPSSHGVGLSSWPSGTVVAVNVT